jgi:threonine/homoserine/homoserine lactone efflux protein
MLLLSLFLFGLFFSFAGSITPSMLNMTALKISLEKGRKATNSYALGVAITAIPQVIVAVILTKYIADNPIILETLEKAGIFIFMLLSYYFYKESKKAKIKVEEVKAKKENHFLTGITLSVLNMFAIPFFCGIVILLETFELFSFQIIPVFFFILGSVIGTFYILFLYGKYAKIIQRKTGRLTNNVNLVLAILTAAVAIFTVIKLIF